LRNDIIVIVDEAHRSQYDVLALNMRTALPNAASPVELCDAFLTEVVEANAKANPIDALGHTHVKMVRLEVEAYAL
jgi:hypothetical protein